MRNLFISLLTAVIFVANSTFAANTCVNDPTGERGAQNNSINNQLLIAQDPLTKAFLSNYAKSTCPPGTATTSKTATAMSKVTSKTLGIAPIQRNCIQASLQREVGNKGYNCIQGKPMPFENRKETVPCLNDRTLDFIHYSVNQALSCMSPAGAPIDSRFILKKINNETGFNFYVGYVGGVGLGQLTSDPVRELAGWYEKKQVKNKKGKVVKTESTFVPGNATYILENLMKSSNPACAPFKKIVSKELTTPPPTPGTRANYCSWVSAEGMGRSLVYGLGYYLYARDHFIKESLKDRAPALANNSDVVNSLTLVAYGPGGPAQAKALIRTLRMNNSSNPHKVVEQINQSSNYVDQTNDKMKELIGKLKPGVKPSPEDLRGDTCVSK